MRGALCSLLGMANLIQASVESHPPGSLPTSYVPGSFLLVHGTSIVSSTIRFGQHLRFPKVAKTWDDYNHAAGIVSTSGSIVEMLSRGATSDSIEKYRDVQCHVVVPEMTLAQQRIAAEFWQWCLEHHIHYNWFAAFSDGVSCLTGGSLVFGTQGRMICSGMVAAGLCRAGVEGTELWTAGPSHVFPAELGIRTGLADLPA